jgi:chromosome segregation ATPase
MTNDNLVLEHLRAIRADQTDMKGDIREIKSRLTTLENGQATIIQHLGHLSGSDAEQHASYDRLLERIERIEKRLEIADEP